MFVNTAIVVTVLFPGHNVCLYIYIYINMYIYMCYIYLRTDDVKLNNKIPGLEAVFM